MNVLHTVCIVGEKMIVMSAINLSLCLQHVFHSRVTSVARKSTYMHAAFLTVDVFRVLKVLNCSLKYMYLGCRQYIQVTDCHKLSQGCQEKSVLNVSICRQLMLR